MFARLIWPVQRVWRLLTAPHPSLDDAVERRQSQLLSTLLGVTCLVSVAGAVVWVAATPLHLIWPGSNLPINAIGLTGLAVLWALARTRHYRWAAGLAAVFLSSLVFLLAIPDHDLNELFLLDFLFLPVFIASLLLPLRVAQGIALANLACLLIFPWLTPDPAASATLVLVGPLIVNLTAFSLIFVGIKHRDQVERDRQMALRQSEQRFATAFRFNPAAMAIARLSDGVVLDVNDAYVQALGCSREALVGHPLFALAAEPQETGRVHRLIEKGTLRDVEIRLRIGSGETRAALVSVEHIELANDPCALIALYDISSLKRAEAEALRRVEEFGALYEVARDIATQQDLPTLLQTIVNRATTLMNTQGGHVFLYDPARSELEMVVSQGPAPAASGIRVPVGRGMSGRVAQTRQPLIVNDYQAWTAYLTEFGGVPYTAVIQVPMMYRGELIGVLSVAHTVSDRAYTEADLGPLTLLAGHAAGAVHNARLLKDAQLQARQLALVYEAGLTLNRELDATVQLEVLLTSAMSALSGNYAEFFRFDDTARSLHFEFGIGYDELATARLQNLDIDNDGLGQVARTLAVYNLPDVHAVSTWVVCDPHIRSGMWVPIIHQSRLLGVMGVLSQRPAAFDAEAERLSLLFANQVAAAMANARLFGETRQRLLELESLNRVSVSLRSAQTLNEMFPRLLDETLTLFDTDSGMIWMFDEARATVASVAARGWCRQLSESAVVPGQGIVGSVFTTGQLYISIDFTQTPLVPQADGPHPEAGWGGACVPIRTAEKVVGVLCVSISRPREMSNAEVRLLSTLAEIAGSATHRMTLFDLLRRRANQLATVNALGRALAETLNLDEMYERMYQATSHLLPDSGAVFISMFDAERELITCAYAVAGGQTLEAGRLPPVRLVPPGAGLQSEAIHTRRPVIANDPRTGDHDAPGHETRFLEDEDSPARSVLCSPMLAKGEVTGVLLVQHPAANRYTQADAELLSLMGNTGAAAIQNARLFAETQRRLDRLQALRAIDNAISSSLDQRVTLAVVLDQAITQLEVDAAAVLLLDGFTQMLHATVSRGFRTRPTAIIRLGEGAVGQAALERRSVEVPDLIQLHAQWPRAEVLSAEGYRSYFAAPLIAKGQVKGVLEVARRTPLRPDKEWLDFLETLAGQAAIAIESAALFEELERSNIHLVLAYDTTLEGWSHALDLRDKETEGHTRRVTDMTMRLARAMNIEDADSVHMRRGALLHDIGKMGIPDSILLKNGSLTEAEWEIMRKHPVYAYELLSPITFLRPALDIPYCHHEKWDGTGYPRGLKGDQIPLAARVFAVADVWDALTSDRPYRPAWPKEKAVNYICDNSGTHFDPQVVYAFVQLLAGERLPDLPVGLLASRSDSMAERLE